MTVSSIVPVNTYTGNSTVKKFDFDFLIESENELIVQHISEDNVITTLTLGVDYSINEIGNQNGSYIIFPLENSSYNVLKENEKITLMLTLSIKQESEFKNSSYFNLNILEWTFDYIVRILQILSRKIERCVKVGEGLSSSPDELMNELNESKRIAINAAESALESKKIAEENKNDCIGYLEEYNQKVIKFNSEYEKCLQSIIDKGIDTRCDLDLSNLSETGEKHFLNKTQISRCILEASNGVATVIDNVITIHQGLKLSFSNGRNSDNTLKNLEYTLQSDLVRDYKVTGLLPADTRGVLYFWIKTDNLNSKSMTAMQESGVGQGSTVPANYSGVFYNTKENTIKFYTRGSLTPGYETAIYIPVANYVVDSKQNISLTPYQTLKVMDYNDFINNGISNVICTTAPTTVSTASSQRPSVVIENYVNGASGYFVRSDGYCEQWGAIDDQTTNPITVSLMKPYVNNLFSISAISYWQATGNSKDLQINLTASNLSFEVYRQDKSAKFNWRTCGYIK